MAVHSLSRVARLSKQLVQQRAFMQTICCVLLAASMICFCGCGPTGEAVPEPSPFGEAVPEPSPFGEDPADTGASPEAAPSTEGKPTATEGTSKAATPPGTSPKGDDAALPPLSVKAWTAPADLQVAFKKLAGAKTRKPVSIDGKWEGYFFRYPYPIKLSLDLSAGGAPVAPKARPGYPRLSTKKEPLTGVGLSGNLTQTAISTDRKLRLDRIIPGENEVAGSFDANAGTFALHPDVAGTRARFRHTPLTFSGVVIPASGDHGETLVATFGQNRYGVDFIVLTRTTHSQKQLIEPVVAAARFLSSGSNFPRTDEGIAVVAKTGPFRPITELHRFDNSIVKWGSRLLDEYPDMEIARSDSGVLGARALNLFEDEYFKQHFGVSYFDIPEQDSVWLNVGMVTGWPRSVAEREKMRGYSYLGRAFRTTGNFGRLENITRLIALQELRRYRRDLLNDFKSMKPSPTALDEIELRSTAAATAFKPLWPSEQQKFAQEKEAAQRRIGSESLELAAAQSIQHAEGLDGANALARWTPEHRRQLAFATPDSRKRIADWMNGKLESLAAPIALSHLPEVKAHGTSPTSLVAMARWQQEIAARYRLLMRTEAFQTLSKHIRHHRTQLLNSLRNELLQKIAEQKSVAAVDSVTRKYLSIPGDRQTTAGSELVTAAAAQKSKIDEAAYLAKFSAREQGWLKTGTATAVTGPDEEEVRLALLRAIAATGGEMVDAHTAHYTNPLMRPFGFYMIVHIDRIRLTSPPKKTDSGWECTWRATMRAKYSDAFYDNFGRGGKNDPIFRMFEKLVETSSAGGDARTDTLIPTSKGWRSPTMTSRALSSMFGGR